MPDATALVRIALGNLLNPVPGEGREMAQNIYEATITPAAENEPVIVSIPANDGAHATRLIEAQFGPVKHWWSEPTPKRLADEGASHT